MVYRICNVMQTAAVSTAEACFCHNKSYWRIQFTIVACSHNVSWRKEGCSNCKVGVNKSVGGIHYIGT